MEAKDTTDMKVLCKQEMGTHVGISCFLCISEDYARPGVEQELGSCGGSPRVRVIPPGRR